MSDLVGVNDTLPVRLGGVSSSSGLPDNYADVNAGGSLQVAGQGTAGTPAGGVVSIQGVASGTAVPVSQSGSWTTAVTQSTSPWVTKDQANGPVTPGAVASFSELIGGQFNTSLPTLSNTQQSAVQLDSSGRLIIAPLTTLSVIKVDLQDGSGNGITSTFFSPKQALDVNVVANPIPANQTFTGTIAANGQTVTSNPGGSVLIEITGTWSGTISLTGTIGAAGFGIFSSAINGASPLTYIYNTITANGLYKVLNPAAFTSIVLTGTSWVSGTANITINTSAVADVIEAVQLNQANFLATTFQGGTWTTGRTWSLLNTTDSVNAVQSGAWNITNITGTVSLPTGASTSALQTTGNTSLATIATTLTLAQGSTTSGQTGALTMGAVTTAAPTYSTGQTNPISLTTTGALRIDGSGSTQPISGNVTANQGTSPWTVQGDSASGASKAGNPVQIGGVFNTTQPTVTPGQTVEAQSTARGALIVATGVDNFNINNISGTVSLPTGAATSTNQSTEITSLQLIDNPVGSVAAGVAGTSSFLIGGVFNTALPTLTNTQQAAIQLDSSGRLIISPITSSSIVTVSNFPTTVDTNYGAVGASTIRTASEIGNSTGAASFGAGTTSAQTLRVSANVSDGAGNTIGSTNSSLQVVDVINVSASQATLSVSNTATACRVGGANLTNRRQLIINVATTGYSYGFAVGSQPFALPSGTTLVFPYGPNITVWVVRSTGTAASVFVAELA